MDTLMKLQGKLFAVAFAILAAIEIIGFIQDMDRKWCLAVAAVCCIISAAMYIQSKRD